MTPWPAAGQASLSITYSWSLLKLLPIELVMPSNSLILYCPFSSCLQSFPESGCFPMSQFFISGCQSIGVSALASVLPMNIQDWFILGLTDFILQSKKLSRVFSSTTVQKHQFCSDFGAPQNKVSHCFHFFPIYLSWSDETGCHDLCFLNVEF